ncbi:MAG TPA: RES family NAD+ phosphorylase [Verrucomicrobiae bacterium]|nr:RES family NAD+ phosphorylase [Verrucomicrobiae bacterium]
MALELRTPTQSVYRVARYPDAWQLPDWSRAKDGTFGNRFDDPESDYRVLYAASQEVSCYVETLARFRPDLTLLEELQEIEGDDDFLPVGEVPLSWCENRVIGTAAADGNYADIYAVEWIALLRRKLVSDCLRLGLRDLDASALQNSSPRTLTQLVSRIVYEIGLAGVYYRSRYGHNLENWALFEPCRIHRTKSKRVTADDPALEEAMEILGLKFAKK